MDKEQILYALKSGQLSLDGRFIYGSNYTFMVTCQDEGDGFKAVYKPMEGERPLWDFPDQTLGKREVAAYQLSEALGWNLVPPTVFRTQPAPMGPGSLQIFVDHDPEIHYFNFTKQDQIHLPRVMCFDLLINNADRKAGHLLFDPQGELWLIDHGLSFHVEDKLRTVIWDHAGEPIPKNLLADIAALIPTLDPDGPLRQDLASFLIPAEIIALQTRAQTLLEARTFPRPPEDRRAYPWPLI